MTGGENVMGGSDPVQVRRSRGSGCADHGWTSKDPSPSLLIRPVPQVHGLCGVAVVNPGPPDRLDTGAVEQPYSGAEHDRRQVHVELVD